MRALFAVAVGIVAGFAFAVYQAIQNIIHQPTGMIGFPTPEPPEPAIPIVVGLLATLVAWLIAPVFEPPLRKLAQQFRRLPRGRRTAAVLVAFLVACALFQLIVSLGVPLQPCRHTVGNVLNGVCEDARPAWLATLDPVARFEVDHWPQLQGVALVLVAFEVACFVYLLSVRLGDGDGAGSRSLGSGNRHGLALLLGVIVAFAAFFLYGPVIRQCLSYCDNADPTWLASLEPLQRFANEHAGLVPWIDLGLGVAAALAVEAIDYWAKARYRAA